MKHILVSLFRGGDVNVSLIYILLQLLKTLSGNQTTGIVMVYLLLLLCYLPTTINIVLPEMPSISVDIKTRVLLDAKVQSISPYDSADLMECIYHKGTNSIKYLSLSCSSG